MALSVFFWSFWTRGVAFESESDLREKGAYKTPDMLLQVPMAVKGPINEVWFDNLFTEHG